MQYSLNQEQVLMIYTKIWYHTNQIKQLQGKDFWGGEILFYIFKKSSQQKRQQSEFICGHLLSLPLAIK